MRTALSLIAASLLLSTGSAVVQVTQAQEFVCTTSYHDYDVPHPTRRGMFISHFSDNGAPQSIVTTSETDTTCVDSPPEDDGPQEPEEPEEPAV